MVPDVGGQVQRSQMYTTEEAQHIAQTIGQQIGGLGRVATMIVGYGFGSHTEGGLSFRFKAKAKELHGKSPNYIRITLDPSDTYTVIFGRIHGHNYSELETISEVYCDQIQGLLEDTTGLYFTLHGRVQFR